MLLPKNNTPKCGDCGQDMIEIYKTGRSIEVGDFDAKDGSWKAYGIRDEILFQCSECKTVKID